MRWGEQRPSGRGIDYEQLILIARSEVACDVNPTMAHKVEKEAFASFVLVEPGVVRTNWQVRVEDPAVKDSSTNTAPESFTDLPDRWQFVVSAQDEQTCLIGRGKANVNAERLHQRLNFFLAEGLTVWIVNDDDAAIASRGLLTGVKIDLQFLRTSTIQPKTNWVSSV